MLSSLPHVLFFRMQQQKPVCELLGVTGSKSLSHALTHYLFSPPYLPRMPPHSALHLTSLIGHAEHQYLTLLMGVCDAQPAINPLATMKARET